MMRVNPIKSTDDIERAVAQAMANPEAQWYVTRVAKALGAEDLLPGSWQMEADAISSFRDYRSAGASEEQSFDRVGELVESVVASAVKHTSGESTFDDAVTMAVSASIQAEMDSLGTEFEDVLSVSLSALVAGGHVDATTAALLSPEMRDEAFVEAIESDADGEGLTAGILKRVKTAEGALRYGEDIGEIIRPSDEVDAPDAPNAPDAPTPVAEVPQAPERKGFFRRRPKPTPPAGQQQRPSDSVEEYSVTAPVAEPNVPEGAVRINPDNGSSLTNPPQPSRNSAATTPAGVPEFNEREFNARIDARAATQEAEKAEKAAPAKAAEQPKPAAKAESGSNAASMPAWLEQSLAREYENASQQGEGAPDTFEEFRDAKYKQIQEEEARRLESSTQSLRERVSKTKEAKKAKEAEPEKAESAPKSEKDEKAPKVEKAPKTAKPEKKSDSKKEPDQPSESTRNAEEVAAEEAAKVAAEDPEGIALSRGESISLADAARAARERRQAVADRAASASRTNKIDTTRRPKRDKAANTETTETPKAEEKTPEPETPKAEEKAAEVETPKADAPEAAPEAPKTEAPKAKPAKKAAPARRTPVITEPTPAASPRNEKPFVVKKTSTSSGKTKYMVQNVGKTVGLEVEWGQADYSGKREITSGKLNGKEISLSDARAIHNARVWYDDNDKVHVDRYAGESSLPKDELLKAIEASRGTKSASRSVETIEVSDTTNNLNRNPRFRPQPTSIDGAAREARMQAAREAMEAARSRVDSPTQRRDDAAEQRVVDNAVQQENNGNRRIVLTEENPTVVLTGPNAGQPARTPDRTGNEPVAPPSTPPGVDPDSRPTDGTPRRRPARRPAGPPTPTREPAAIPPSTPDSSANPIPGGRRSDPNSPYNPEDNAPEMVIPGTSSSNDPSSPDYDPGPISEDDPFRNPDTENLAEPDRPEDDPFAPENNPNYTPGPYRWNDNESAATDSEDDSDSNADENEVADVQDDSDLSPEERNTAEAKAEREARIAKLRNQFRDSKGRLPAASKRKKGKMSLLQAAKEIGTGFMTGFTASGRFVDTPEGEEWYDAPIGTPIRRKPKVLGKIEHAVKAVTPDVDKDSIHTDDIRRGHAGVHPSNIKVGSKIHNANGSFTVKGHNTPETDPSLSPGEHRIRVTRDADGADRAIKFYPNEGWNTEEHKSGTAKPSGSRHLQTLDKSDPSKIKVGQKFHDRDGDYEAVTHDGSDSPIASGDDDGAYRLRIRKIGDPENTTRSVTFTGGITSGDPAEDHDDERSAHVEDSKVDKGSKVRVESARIPSASKPKSTITAPGTGNSSAPEILETTDVPTPSAKADVTPSPEQFRRVADTLNRVSQGNTKYDGGYRAKEVAKLSREDRDLMLKMINDNKTFENYRARKNGQLAPSLVLQERTQLSVKASLERLNNIEDGKVTPGPSEPLPAGMERATDATPDVTPDAPAAPEAPSADVPDATPDVTTPEPVESKGSYTEAEMRKAGEEAILTDPVAARALYERMKSEVKAGNASAKDLAAAWKNYMAVRDGKPGTLPVGTKDEKKVETPEAPKVETPAAEAPEAAAPAEVKIAEPADEYSALAMETHKSWLDHGFYSLVHRVRETAQRYQREGYEGPGPIANNNLELMKMSRAMGAAGREKKMQFADLMAGQIVSEAHASEPSPKDFYRGIQLVEEDVQKLRDAVGGQVSLPLSSFTPNAERAREFADDPAIASSTVYKPDEGKPVLIYVSRGAKTATMSDSGRDEESVIFGTFTIDAVTEKHGRTEVDLTQVSLVETPSDDPFRISVQAPGAKTETITPTADEDAPNPDAPSVAGNAPEASADAQAVPTPEAPAAPAAPAADTKESRRAQRKADMAARRAKTQEMQDKSESDKKKLSGAPLRRIENIRVDQLRPSDRVEFREGRDISKFLSDDDPDARVVNMIGVKSVEPANKLSPRIPSDDIRVEWAVGGGTAKWDKNKRVNIVRPATSDEVFGKAELDDETRVLTPEEEVARATKIYDKAVADGENPHRLDKLRKERDALQERVDANSDTSAAEAAPEAATPDKPVLTEADHAARAKAQNEAYQNKRNADIKKRSEDDRLLRTAPLERIANIRVDQLRPHDRLEFRQDPSKSALNMYGPEDALVVEQEKIRIVDPATRRNPKDTSGDVTLYFEGNKVGKLTLKGDARVAVMRPSTSDQVFGEANLDAETQRLTPEEQLAHAIRMYDLASNAKFMTPARLEAYRKERDRLQELVGTKAEAEPEVDIEDENAKKATLQFIQTRNEANRVYTKAMMEAAIKKTPEAIAKRDAAKAALDAADANVVNDQVNSARATNSVLEGTKPAIAAKPRPKSEPAVTPEPAVVEPEVDKPEAIKPVEDVKAPETPEPVATKPVSDPASTTTSTGTSPAADGGTLSPDQTGVTFIKDKLQTYGVVNYGAKGKDPERFTPKTSLADGTKPTVGQRVIGVDGRLGTVSETYQTHSGVSWDDGTKKSITNKKLNAHEVATPSSDSATPSAPEAATPAAPFKPQPMNTNPEFVKGLSDEDLDAQHKAALMRARLTRGSNARSADYADAKAAADTARIEKDKRANPPAAS